jgi:diaminohydroxyphosphoribosylaminopyrimidine deaminase/5-amino-6-(5-phosphoribosylamino)uracil reductase
VKTIETAPVLVVATSDAPAENVQRLTNSGCEVHICDGNTAAERLHRLLVELGQRRMTNVLFEGGATLLGTLHDADAIDEVHVFIAPKILGGANAPSPIGGTGSARIADAKLLADWTITELEGDIYARCRKCGTSGSDVSQHN